MRNVAGALVLMLLANGAPAQRVGEPAPPIAARAAGDRQERVTLAAQRGKVVVLCFLRTDAPDADQTFATLARVHAALGPRGVEVIAVTSEEREAAVAAARERGAAFDLICGSDAAESYGVVSFPRAVLIDPQGVIAWKGDPSDDLERRVGELVSRAPPRRVDPGSLGRRLEQARRLQADGHLGRAYALVSEVAELASGDERLAADAAALVGQLEKAARERLEDLRQAVRARAFDDAAKHAAELSEYFAGAGFSDEVEREAERIRADPSGRNALDRARREVAAQRQLDQAAELEQERQFAAALDAYRGVAEKFTGTAGAAQAEQAALRLAADEGVREQLRRDRAEAEAQRWLHIAEQFVRVEMPDQAREWFRKVIDEHPASAAARSAREQLARLK